MVGALFDTNILIDYLNGVIEARDELRLYQDRAISLISWMEVMVGVDPSVSDDTEAFLRGFTIIAPDIRIATRAVELRREERIKLPDAMIWATAQINDLLLVTRNSKDFPADYPGVRIPYQI